MKSFTLRDFVRESNRIEGIHYSGRKLNEDIAAHEDFLSRDILTVPGICAFALRVTRGEGRLRCREGMNVRVGNHLPPQGGMHVETALGNWLIASHEAYRGHIAFEQLHPFMDGNGRTGRVLWLWRMGGIEGAPLGFLHHFYYQTLDWQQPRKAQPYEDRTALHNAEFLISRSQLSERAHGGTP